MLHVPRLLATLYLVAAGLAAAATTGYHRFHEGNSLTDPLTARNIGLHSLATNCGFARDSVGQVIIAGTPIDWAWENRQSQFVGVLTNGGYELLVLQPFRITQLDWFEREAIAAASVYRFALQYSPNATLVVYYTWASVTSNANPDQTFVNQMQGVTNYLEFFTDVMQQEFPTKKVFVVPSGIALMKMAADIAAGQGPEGVPSITNWFDPMGTTGASSIHPNENGFWLSCLVHFDSYYSEYYASHPEKVGNLPTNIPFTIYWRGSNDASWTRWPSVTSNQSAYCQRIAWLAVTNYPRTFLSGIPRVKGDTNAPSAPGAPYGAILSSNTFSLAWGASTDNVAVARYTIMTNHEYAVNVNVTSTNATIILTNVTSQSVEVTVRAWDTSYNFADSTFIIPEPVVAGALIVPLLLRAASRASK